MKGEGERILLDQLNFAGHDFETEYRFEPARKWRADFYFALANLIVEIEGIGYGRSVSRHQIGYGYESDCEKYNAIINKGISLFRFTPNMVKGSGRRRSVKNRIMEPAIDTIDRFVLGEKHFEKIDRSRQGYVKDFMEKNAKKRR
ncbi:MAG: hypothetical protein ISN29_01495 [Gammaproteobacteria bacterium AqS3]|nr:hypothetical protein [Gammaproteobacteria bacterium AqS3]